ncbi:MAG: hypothetical protein EAZ07_08175 [Cytophagales bacterium]|nr:MAG: hypothetical protein EAZ07_08175 [Cytophagales bacterium]
MRILTLLLLVGIGTAISVLFGVVHDQITYTLSPEFYNQVRFPQLGINSSEGRLGAGLVAFFSSWKIGFIISLVLSFTGLIHANNPKIIKFTFESFIIVMITTSVFTAFGLVFNFLFGNSLSSTTSNNFTNPQFLIIQNIHNYTYLGSVIGMMIGIYWQFYRRKKQKN